MAQLKDLLVAGPSRFIGDVFAGLMNSNDHLPNVTNTYSLGSSSKIWKQLYVGSITASDEITGNILSITSDASVGGNLTVSGSINATISGNAATATGFANAKTIALTGDVTGSASGGNGNNGWSIATTIGAGKVTNSMLAGSISNDKLQSSEITLAGLPIALGSSISASSLLSSLGLTSAMHFIGITTTAISDGATTSPITVGGSSHTPAAGDVVIYSNNEYVWTSGNAWELLGQDGSFKVVQTAYDSSTVTASNANSSVMISDISQNAQGVITVTKKHVITGSTLTITANGGTTPSQGSWVFDGSENQEIDFVPGTGISITSDASNRIKISNTVENTHYTANMILSAAANSTTALTSDHVGPYLTLIENNTVRKSIQITGAGYTSVSGNASAITISSTDQKVKQNPVANNTNSNYRLLLSNTTSDSQSANIDEVNRSDQLKYNPSTNTLTVGTVSGNLSGNATSATSAGSVGHSFVIKANNGSTVSKDYWSFNGSADRTINFAPGDGISLKTTTNGNQIEIKNVRIPFVQGTQTAATGTWTGTSEEIDALYDGLTIAYWLPYAGSGNATLNLTIASGATGAKNCYYGGTSRLTTHFQAGSLIFLTYRTAANINGTTYEGWWANANYDSNNLNALRWDYSTITAGANNKIYPYTILMMTNTGCYESLVTSNSTGTSKVKNTTGFVPGRMVVMWANLTTNSGAQLSGNNYCIYEAYTGLDGRYSFNISTTQWDRGKPLYLVGTISNGLFYLADDPWWSQTLPITEDNKVYIYIGSIYYPASADKTYCFNLAPYHPMYAYKNGALRLLSTGALDADKVAHSFTITGNGGTTNESGSWVFDGSADRTINIKAGTGISITNGVNEITITNSARDSHYTTAMYLGASNSATTNNANNTTSPYLMVLDNSTVRNRIQFTGSGATTVKGTSTSGTNAGTVTISSTDENVEQLLVNNSNSNVNYRLLLTEAANTSSTVGSTHFSTNLMFNPSTGLMSGQSLSLTGTLNVTQNATFANPVYANGGLTVSDLLVTGNSAFSITPTAPTAAAGTNDTQLATTAFVQAALQSGVMGNGSPYKTARYDSTGEVIEAAMHHTCDEYQYVITDYVNGGYSPAFKLIGKNQQISLLIGSGNDNRGLYNDKTSAWMLYWDSNNYAILNSGKFGINGKNASYNFYVNGTSYFNGATSINGATTITGNTTHNGIVYFANGTTYYINNSAQGYLANLGINGTDTSYRLYINGDSYFNGGAYAKSFYHFNGNAIQDGSWITGTTGTTSATGTNILTLGNSTATGSTNNSKGYLRIYGGSTGYAELTYNDTRLQSDKSLYFSTSTASGISNEIRGIMATNDYWRIAGGATAANSGYLEIATANEGTEPIYVRQYANDFSSATRTLTLLDASGNTIVPGKIERTFTASAQVPMLQMYGGDYDNYLFKIGSNASNGDQYFGYALKYIGTGSGVANYLQLLADNQNGTDVIAIGINQTGKIGLGDNPLTDYRLYVNGDSQFKGGVYPQATNTYDLGSSELKWKTIYAQSFSPDLEANVTVTLGNGKTWVDLPLTNVQLQSIMNGTNIIQLYDDTRTSGAQVRYLTYWSGIFSWTTSYTNGSSVYSEIPLHGAGHSLSDRQYQLRIVYPPQGDTTHNWATNGTQGGSYFQIKLSNASANAPTAAQSIRVRIKHIM